MDSVRRHFVCSSEVPAELSPDRCKNNNKLLHLNFYFPASLLTPSLLLPWAGFPVKLHVLTSLSEARFQWNQVKILTFYKYIKGPKLSDFFFLGLTILKTILSLNVFISIIIIIIIFIIHSNITKYADISKGHT